MFTRQSVRGRYAIIAVAPHYQSSRSTTGSPSPLTGCRCVSSNRSCCDTNWILRCSQSNSSQERSVSKLGRENQRKCLQNQSPARHQREQRVATSFFYLWKAVTHGRSGRLGGQPSSVLMDFSPIWDTCYMLSAIHATRAFAVPGIMIELI